MTETSCGAGTEQKTWEPNPVCTVWSRSQRGDWTALYSQFAGCQLPATVCKLKKIIISVRCMRHIMSQRPLGVNLQLSEIFSFCSPSKDCVRPSTSCRLRLVWPSSQWLPCLASAPSAAACTCSAASHQRRARNSTSKISRTSSIMTSTWKPHHWRTRCLLISSSWSLMLEHVLQELSADCYCWL